jgi:hypothetical protein
MKKQYNCHQKDIRNYKIGDQIWLETVNLKTKQPTKKLDNKQVGPFMTLEKVSELAYKLKIPPGL